MPGINRRHLFALVKKEFIQSLRDSSSILIAFVLPIVLLLIYGSGISLDSTVVKLGIVVEDQGAAAQSFLESFRSSPFFDVSYSRERDGFYEQLEKGSLHGVVVIPAYFSERFEQDDSTAPIQVIADGTAPNTASFVQNYILGTWKNWRQIYLSDAPKTPFGIAADARFWFNQEQMSSFYIIPGSIAIIITLIGTLLTSFVIAREWERGTMEALLATPVTIREIILSKMIPYFIYGMASMTLCTFIAIEFYHVPFRGSWWVLILITTLFLFSSLGVGLLISTIARNQFIASQAAIVSAYLPAFILSGFLFDINNMPLPIRAVTYLIPARYFVSCLQTLFLAGNIPSVLLRNGLFLFCFSLILFIVIRKVSRKRID